MLPLHPHVGDLILMILEERGGFIVPQLRMLFVSKGVCPHPHPKWEKKPSQARVLLTGVLRRFVPYIRVSWPLGEAPRTGKTTPHKNH
ncbi:hypothetical protein JTE90_009708 [Oedothorax gibbosus]|uniref:Uncharacterized protein n=1 Tax=Oedothorax gibbosus TaxID=931172 RepID=A0AAV6V9S8_9ARAC|nr:hypothetical protein JTE90_009708 [Oedothorax gibbosus]